MIKYEDCKIIRGPDGRPKFNVDIERTPITLGLKRNISQAVKLYCKHCNISLDAFVKITLNEKILSMNYPKEIEKEVDELLKGELLSLGPPPGYFKRIKEMRKRLDEELSSEEGEKELHSKKDSVSTFVKKVHDEYNNNDLKQQKEDPSKTMSQPVLDTRDPDSSSDCKGEQEKI